MMSLLLRRLSKLSSEKPVLVRSSVLRRSNGFSSSSLQTPPCTIICADPCGADLGKLVIMNATTSSCTDLEKKVPLELVDSDPMVTIGASHGWVATLKDDGIVRLQDDLNPYASDTDPKRISLPPLVTLPGCQTQVVTNVAMSSSSPEDEDCVVAVKFLGAQLSFCRPAQANSEWVNFRIASPCFYSSPVMFSEKHDIFCIPGSGGHLIGSWDPRAHKHKPKFQRLRFQNLPELTKTKRELLQSCCTSEHLVESRSTGETFLVKLYRKATASGTVKMQTKALMVFKLDEEGNALYTQDIGDLCIFISQAEPFAVPASSFPGMSRNCVEFFDVEESISVSLPHSSIVGGNCTFKAPYQIPPQNIEGKDLQLLKSIRQFYCDLEEFKNILKPRLKLIVQNDEREWSFVFVSKAHPSNYQASKSVKKVYAKLEVEFSSKKRERCCKLLDVHGPDGNFWEDLELEITECISKTLDRCAQFYEDEIRKLSEQRFMPIWNFCNFFILKESLAFIFEMAHVHEDALREYDELELCYLETECNALLYAGSLCNYCMFSGADRSNCFSSPRWSCCT